MRFAQTTRSPLSNKQLRRSHSLLILLDECILKSLNIAKCFASYGSFLRQVQDIQREQF